MRHDAARAIDHGFPYRKFVKSEYVVAEQWLIPERGSVEGSEPFFPMDGEHAAYAGLRPSVCECARRDERHC